MVQLQYRALNRLGWRRMQRERREHLLVGGSRAFLRKSVSFPFLSLSLSISLFTLQLLVKTTDALLLASHDFVVIISGTRRTYRTKSFNPSSALLTRSSNSSSFDKYTFIASSRWIRFRREYWRYCSGQGGLGRRFDGCQR